MTTEIETTPASGSRADAGSEATPRRWVAPAVLLFLSVACCSPLWDAGWFGSHEEIRPVARALAAYHEIADGDLFPRWISSGYLGKGVPLFNFYPPAFSLTVAYLHALGVPILLATKGVILALFFAGAWGAYLWARRHFGHWPALVAGVLYLFAPYHFVDLYVRGATAEFTSLAFLPYLFLSIDLAAERFSARALASVALASAGIVLSHFLSALMIAPFAALYALARAVALRGGVAAIGRVVAGALLGAALSAFFWLPALAERYALSAERGKKIVEGYNSPFLHFVEPYQWFDPAWEFGASYPTGYPDEMSFQVGYLLAAAVAASLLLSWRLARPGRGFLLLSLSLGFVALWLTTSASAPWYSLFSPYQMVQFPWRFLGPATVFLAVGGAGFASSLSERRPWAGPVLASAVAILSLALSADHRTVREPWNIPDERAAVEAIVAADPWSAKFGNEDEYLPKDASREVANSEPGGPYPQALNAVISGVRPGRADLAFEVAVEAGHAIVVVPWLNFPGWKATLDGQEVPILPGPDGLICFTVPSGRHLARVHFGTTPPRMIGWALAIGGLLLLGALALRERRAVA